MRIRIIREGQSETTVEYDGKGPLSRAIWLSGKLEPIPLCAGIGRCGKCRVRFVSTPPVALEEEVERLGKEAVDAGWRLACRCQIPDSEEVVLYRVRDLELRMSLWQRIFGVGTVCVHSSDKTEPHLELLSVKQPREVKELIFRQVEQAKEKRRMRTMEMVGAQDDGAEQEAQDWMDDSVDQ